MLKTTQVGIDLIKEFEGFRSKPYLCPAKVWTIGYGNTFYPNGKRVTQNDNPITEAEAEILLRHVVPEFEGYVNNLVTADLAWCQFDALVSFTYNLGPTNLEISTLLKKVNKDHCDITIMAEFNKWINSDGKPLMGLIRRRKAEAALYYSC